MYLLDTNACIRLLNGTSSKLQQRLASEHPASLLLCSVVKAELHYGARGSSRVGENLALLARFFEPFVSVAFDDDCAAHAGLIRAELAASGTPIGPMDVLIAATARANDLTLVSNNQREFSRVLGLRLEDWEA